MTEAIALGTPVIEFNVTNKQIQQSLEPMAYVARSEEDLINIFKGRAEKPRTEDWVKLNFANLGRATEKIVTYLEKKHG